MPVIFAKVTDVAKNSFADIAYNPITSNFAGPTPNLSVSIILLLNTVLATYKNRIISLRYPSLNHWNSSLTFEYQVFQPWMSNNN